MRYPLIAALAIGVLTGTSITVAAQGVAGTNNTPSQPARNAGPLNSAPIGPSSSSVTGNQADTSPGNTETLPEPKHVNGPDAHHHAKKTDDSATQ